MPTQATISGAAGTILDVEACCRRENQQTERLRWRCSASVFPGEIRHASTVLHNVANDLAADDCIQTIIDLLLGRSLSKLEMSLCDRAVIYRLDKLLTHLNGEVMKGFVSQKEEAKRDVRSRMKPDSLNFRAAGMLTLLWVMILGCKRGQTAATDTPGFSSVTTTNAETYIVPKDRKDIWFQFTSNRYDINVGIRQRATVWVDTNGLMNRIQLEVLDGKGSSIYLNDHNGDGEMDSKTYMRSRERFVMFHGSWCKVVGRTNKLPLIESGGAVVPLRFESGMWTNAIP